MKYSDGKICAMASLKIERLSIRSIILNGGMVNLLKIFLKIRIPNIIEIKCPKNEEPGSMIAESSK